MFCSGCGAKLNDGARFCEHCGNAVDAGVARPPEHHFDGTDALAVGGIGASLLGGAGAVT